MRFALLATGLLAIAARLTVLADGGDVANTATMAAFLVATMGYVVATIMD